MPTVGSEGSRRKAGAIERSIGILILAFLTALVAIVAGTSFLPVSLAGQIPGLRQIRHWTGADARSLFDPQSDTIKPTLAPIDIRAAGAMLPERLVPWKRIGLASLRIEQAAVRVTTASQPVDTAEAGLEASGLSPEDELVQAFRSLGITSAWRAAYRREDGVREVLSVTIAACVDPADAAKLSESLKRPGARAMTVARGGWRGESAPIGGFWAGRYCTLVTGSPETSADDVEPFARQLAGMQLVYGGEPQMIPSPGPAAPPSAAPPVSPARIADFAPVAGGQVLPPARIERYTDNLYEKIDGKEGMFRAFFFVELRFGQYTQAQAQDYFDTYIYDMAEPVNAFGIYMGERSPSAEPWPIGRDGYVSGCSVYFCKDKYYVNVMGPADGGADKLEISKTIAQSIAATIPDSDQPFPLERYFPAEGRTPNTLKYEATSALGYDFLQQVFIADYKTGEKTYKIFLSQTADAGAARARFDKFVEATAKYDKVLSKAADGEDQIMVGESLGVFTVAFTKGAFFGGVTECEDQTLATKQAEVVRSGLPGLMTGAGGASSAPSDRPVETPVTEQEG